MRVILIRATGYLYSSSNPMLYGHTVVWGEGVVVLWNICGSLLPTRKGKLAFFR
jgi:hypothetical protein